MKTFLIIFFILFILLTILVIGGGPIFAVWYYANISLNKIDRERKRTRMIEIAQMHINALNNFLNDKSLDNIIAKYARSKIEQLIIKLNDQSSIDESLLTTARNYEKKITQYITYHKQKVSSLKYKQQEKSIKEKEAKRLQNEFLEKEAAARAKRDEDARKAEELRREKVKKERDRQKSSRTDYENNANKDNSDYYHSNHNTHEGQGSKQSKNDSNTRINAKNRYCPYQILGKDKNSTNDEIKQAYYRLMKQYHPDQVEHLGQELKDLALEMTKKINLAFNQIKRERSL